MRSPPPQTSVTLAGFALGAVALASGLPEQVPPSLTAWTGRTFWLGTPMVAFLLPAAMLVSSRLLRGLYVEHPVGEPSPPDVIATYDAIMLRVAVFVTGVHAVVLVAVLGLLSGRKWAGVLVPLMLGFTMISIGNLLPRTRPNLAIGIRTRLTLADPALWLRIHRRAGYMTVASGAVIVVSAIAVPRPVGPGMILLVAPAAVAGACLLLWVSRKHVRA